MESEATLINYVKTGNLTNLIRCLNQDPVQIHVRHASGKSLLLLAAYYRQTAIIRALIRRGWQPDIYESTALGNYHAVDGQLQVRHSVAFTRCADGTSLLGLATFFGRVQLIKLLLEHDSDTNQLSCSRVETVPLHSAGAYGDSRVAEALIEALLRGGANPNLKQRNGRSALHLAAHKNNCNIARMLLDHRAETRSRDDKAMTPESIAKNKGNDAILELFEHERITAKTEAFINKELLNAMKNGQLGPFSTS